MARSRVPMIVRVQWQESVFSIRVLVGKVKATIRVGMVVGRVKVTVRVSRRLYRVRDSSKLSGSGFG